MASSTQTSGRKRLLISGGALLAVAALSTAAFFADSANINLFGSADGDGIGGGNNFVLETQKQDSSGVADGTWVRANTDGTAVDWVLPDGDTLTPGESTTVEIPLRNNSDNLAGDLKFKIGTVAGKTNEAELWNALRITVEVKKDGAASWTKLADEVTPSSLAAAQTFLNDLATEEEATAKVTVGIVSTAGNDIQGQEAFPKFIVEAQSK
ncbi:hypothetical protein EDF60_0622 [Leucobacter luti]|uniref:hypothetical protein n=1 Tax=Leucobacter luti TaxID=340320 RepID=UPI00104EFA11|nr:hypothetical protein [Leucobacter luti]MCW2288448.1 hypothetical protein [Leucobacter luti]TCK45395.1 hypothetical protein EDF60_0622 [Leucobacter luti]